MKSLFTLAILKKIGLVAMVPTLLVATIATHYIASPTKKTDDSVIHTQSASATKASNSNNGESSKLTQKDDTAVTSNSQPSPSTPATSTLTHQSTTSSTQTPQSPSTSSTSHQQKAISKPTCNAAMKTSYTNLYNSQVTAENTSWSNQVNSWNNYASAHGGSFSGYTQSMVNQYKPAHDTKLAQLQTQYQQNLASINCNV